MSGLAVLIPIALAMGALGLLVFFWAMRNGQFEDLDGAAQRILIDDEELPVGDGAADAEGTATRDPKIND